MDLLKKRIDKWYLKFRQYFFKYKNGFYELPFLVNSPEIMIQGFSRMSFARYNHEQQLLSSNNPFLKSELIHLSLENDLILFLSRSEFKKNIKFKFLYDKEIPAKYYFLRFQITGSRQLDPAAISDGIPYSSNTWLFYKPGARPDNYYFKNSCGTFFTIYFTKDWLDKILCGYSEDEKTGILSFLDSGRDCLIYPAGSSNNYKLFLETIDQKPIAANLRLDEYSKESYLIVKDFISCLQRGSVSAKFFELTSSDQLKIVEAESYLRSFLETDFPGIENIASKVCIAQTSLKNGFRQVYGKSIYKYFQSEKMNWAARRLSENPTLKISNLAAEMGYENASKFSAAFKENIGASPTQYLNQMISKN